MKRYLASILLGLIAAGCATKTTPPAAPSAYDQQLHQTLVEGRRFYELGQLEKAERKFREALATHPNHAAATFYLATIQQEQIKQRRPAIFSYRKVAVTNDQTIPPQQRTLESFGRFDAHTVVEDVINRVGPPDQGLSIKDHGTWFYYFGPEGTNSLVINTIGASFITSVESAGSVLYQRASDEW